MDGDTLTLARPSTSPLEFVTRSVPFRAEPKVKIAERLRVVSFKTLNRKAGEYEAIVSVFGNIDLVGDRVLKGFFAKSLDAWAQSGDPIPSIFSHLWDDPFAHIGYAMAEDVEEVDAGLHVKRAVVDVDKPFAAQVFDLLEQRRIREFSFAYDVIEEKRASDGANDLIEGDLIEFGPTLKGANPATQLIGAKAMRSALDREIASLEKFAGVVIGEKPWERSEPASAGSVTVSIVPQVDRKALDAAAAEISKALEPDGEKAYVQVAGSIEADLEKVHRAVSAWAFDTFGYDLWWSYAEATFPDHVIAYVELWDQSSGEGWYYEIPYSRADDGTVTLGEPAEVAVEATVTPKAHPRLTKANAKEGRRNSADDSTRIQSLHDLAHELGAECETSAADEGDGKSRTKAEDRSGGKAEEFEMSPVRALAEAESGLLELA